MKIGRRSFAKVLCTCAPLLVLPEVPTLFSTGHLLCGPGLPPTWQTTSEWVEGCNAIYDECIEKGNPQTWCLVQWSFCMMACACELVE